MSHGTPSGYNAGCRLECCKAAWRLYRAEQRSGKRVNRGTPERMRGAVEVRLILPILPDPIERVQPDMDDPEWSPASGLRGW